MQVLTPTGYVNIDDLSVGQEVLAYDINDGHVFSNVLEAKVLWSPDMFPPTEAEYEHDENGELVLDENGDPIVLVPAKSSLEIFNETYGEWKFFKINDEWTLFHSQSIWANLNVVHASDLVVGDIIYSDTDEDIVVTSIEEVEVPNWWRLTISGDHSYIADGLTFHNASRYWVGGGSSSNWNATGNTNWGSASGGANNSSVPTSADDVIFDGAGVNGNTSSTISAAITILSLNITTGYTATMTHNDVLTIAGNWTFRNTYTIAGTSGITISASSTITSNSATWPNSLILSGSVATYVLQSNFLMSGLLTISSGGTINTSVGATWTTSGGLMMNAVLLAGSATIILTGGTWSAAGGVVYVGNPLIINGNITISGTVQYGRAGTSVLTYQSGTVTTTGSTLNLYDTCVLNTSGMTWDNVTSNIGNGRTVTLTSNLNIGGLLSIPAISVFNRTTTETVTSAGGLSVNSALSGTAKIILTGGTWSGTSSISNNFDIAGNVTVSGNVSYSTNTITYVSGTVTTTGSNLLIAAGCTLNTNGIIWNSFQNTGTVTITLTSNLTANGGFFGNGNTTINRTTAETVTIFGGIFLQNPLQGTADIYLKGGTWSSTIVGATLNNNLFIDGNVTIGALASYGTRTLTYVSGTVTTTGSNLYISSGCTLNTNGITWNNFSNSSNAKTITLTSNLTIGGLFTNTLATINQSTTQSITCLGGITTAGALTGSAKMILAGGVWTGSANFLSGYIAMITEINGNVTFSTVNGPSLTGSLTYISGTVTTTGSSFRIPGGTTTLNAAGITFNDIYAYNSVFNLTDNLILAGTLGTDGATWNTSTGKTITANGLTFYQTSDTTGNAEIILTGGTWSAAAGSRSLRNALTFNGNVTVSGTVYYRTGPLKYLSGTITTTGSTLALREITTLNTNGMTWNNVTFETAAVTYTLASNFAMSGLLTISVATIINTSVGATFTTSGGMTISNTLTGSATIVLAGGTWSGTNVLSSNLNINGNVTVSGVVQFQSATITYTSGTVTVAGSTLNLRNSSSLNTSGMTWNNVRCDTNTQTMTLLSNFLVGGVFTVTNVLTINTSVGATLNVSGQLAVNNSTSGTANVVLIGGSWTGDTINRINNNLDINGNVTISGNVSYGTGTITYVSGTVTSTGSTLNIAVSCTLNTNGMAWNNIVTPSGTPVITLTSNLLLNGTLTNQANTTINRTTTESLYIYGSLNMNLGLSGTAAVYLMGGTWFGNSTLSNNLFINGNVTISGAVTYSGASLTYLSGDVNTSGSTVTFGGTTTITSGAIEWWNVTHSIFATIKTLVGDMIVRGQFFNNSNNGVINRTTNEKVIIYGSLNVGSSFILDGTAPFYLSGGTWFGTSLVVSNLFIDGDITISGSVSKINGTITYLSGRVRVSNATLNLFQTIGIRGRIDKIPFTSVVIAAGSNISFDYFFSGTPSRACLVSSTGANYNISFTDGFEKIARNVSITGASIARSQQLLVISNSRFNTNRQTNGSGIRYINQSPNGAPKGAASAIDTMTVPALGLVSDPCFQIL